MAWINRSLALVAIWLVPAIVGTAQMVMFWGTGAMGPWDTAVWQLAYWEFWALGTVAVLALGRRFRLERDGLTRGVAVHVCANVGLALAQAAVMVLVGRRLGDPMLGVDPFGAELLAFAGRGMLLSVIVYWAILLVGQVRRDRRRARREAAAAADLRARLTAAQLDALKMQLQPHFLFNTLHAIGALVRRADADAAVGLIRDVGELLRMSLDNVGRQHAPLRAEVDFARRYLEIERVRFRDRLALDIDTPVDTLDAEVPHLVLQPLVENAIKHGISRRPEGGTVRIGARRVGERLHIEVENDGPAAGEPASGPGLGLSNVRARLEHMYPGAHRFVVAPLAGGATRVSLELPYHHA